MTNLDSRLRCDSRLNKTRVNTITKFYPCNTCLPNKTTIGRVWKRIYFFPRQRDCHIPFSATCRSRQLSALGTVVIVMPAGGGFGIVGALIGQLAFAPL